MVDRYATVAEFLAAQPAERLAEVEMLRSIVTDAAPGITEIVKWNSPSFVHAGEDRLTVNVGRGPAVLVLHRGATQPENKSAASAFDGDPSGMLTWHSDIRASMPVPTEHTRAAAVDVVRAWLAT